MVLVSVFREHVWAAGKVGVVGVDVGELAVDEVGEHFPSGLHARSEEVRADFLGCVLEGSKALQFRDRDGGECTQELVVDEVCCVEERVSEAGDLGADENFKGSFRDKEGRCGSGCVLDGGPDVRGGELDRDVVESVSQDALEDVPDAGAPVELVGVDDGAVALDFVCVGLCDLVEDLEDKDALPLCAAEGGRAVAFELGHGGGVHGVDLRVELWDGPPDVLGEEARGLFCEKL